MTKEEWKLQIADIIWYSLGKDWVGNAVDQILALTEQYYREAGWKSPEEVQQEKVNVVMRMWDKGGE